MAPTPHIHAPRIDNLQDNELIYQRFVLVIGSVGPATESNKSPLYISVESPSFPVQTFPCSPLTGAFRALVHLQPGPQDLTFSSCGRDDAKITMRGIIYIPLLHVPPLLLAIMVAEDSPLWMDCPPEKSGSASHRDLAGAVKKMRMWAYMCQAFTAEEMRQNGFGRRSFRLEEEWIQDTLSIWDEEPTFRMTAKVHIVKTTHTVAHLRDSDRAQQNSDARFKDDIYNIFHDALQIYGGPFEAFKSDPHGPVVAGLILDSHYDPKQDLILGHAALGGSGGPFGKVHLGMVGSHTHWAWPRFVEEIVPCLLDATRVTNRSRVGNDNGQCGSFWEACCIGQGAALHEVGHALGLPHQTTGLMARGYVEWNRSFVTTESHSVRLNRSAIDTLPETTSNHWHLADLLHMHSHPLFAQPGDALPKPRAPITMEPAADRLTIVSSAKLALLDWQPAGEPSRAEDVRGQNLERMDILLDDLSRRFGAQKALEAGRAPKRLALTITAADGAQRLVHDVWDVVTSGLVRIPGATFVVMKKSIAAPRMEGRIWKWAVLLSKLDKNGKVILARRLEIRKGAWFDGIYVHYADGSREICGPKFLASGGAKHLGGNPRQLNLVEGDKITKVRLHVPGGWPHFNGFAAYTQRLPNGVGDLDDDRSEVLEPEPGEKIVGFYGKHTQDDGFCPPLEFGILTIPEHATLPVEAYGLAALQNTDGGIGSDEAQAHDVDGNGVKNEDTEDEDED